MTEVVTLYGPYIISGTYIALALAVTFHAVLRKQETGTVIAWVGLAWLAPLIGAFAYYALGVNRIQRRGTALHVGKTLPAKTFPPIAEDAYRIGEPLLSQCPNLPGLATLGANLTGKRLLAGNTVTLLRDGDQAFPAMLEAIAGAETSVALLSYIFDADPIGEQFLQALQSARARGVEIRVLIDAVGASYSKPTMLQRLRDHGVPVAAFLPTLTPRLFSYANLRNHRKILVVDGQLGFSGGTNIRVGHALRRNPKAPVQCAHFRIKGPVVAHLRETFAIDWAFAAGEILRGDAWFPAIEHRQGAVGARGIADGPDEDFEHLANVILGAIAAACRRIRIVSPYFLPDPAIVKALNVAALRGVQVDIVLPSGNNLPPVEWAAMTQLRQLLRKGCRIHYSAPPFDHSKLLVIDGVWSLIGSTNWDPRSLRLNFEFNVECYCATLAAQLEDLIAHKIAGGRALTLAQIDKRSLAVKLRDGLARLASPYL